MGWRRAFAAAFAALSMQALKKGEFGVAVAEDNAENYRESLYTQALPTPGKFLAHFDFRLRSHRDGALKKASPGSSHVAAVSRSPRHLLLCGVSFSPARR